VGSNVRPVQPLKLAVQALTDHYGKLGLSSVYQNPPVGFDGDDFLNMVLAFETQDTPEQVLTVLESIHQRVGRVAGQHKFGPRTLDLDLLLFGALVDPQRRVPRADVLRYSFVLGPLAELAPELRHPVTGVTMAEAWGRYRGPGRLRNLGALAGLNGMEITAGIASQR